jgi:hypothetical protein
MAVFGRAEYGSAIACSSIRKEPGRPFKKRERD